MHRAIGKPLIRRFFLQYGRHGRSSLSFKLPSVNVPTHVQGYVTDLVNKLAEAHEVAKENTWVRQEKMKEYYDKKSTPTKLKEGDKVFPYLEKTPLNLSRNLTHKYVDPYYIARFVRKNTVKLRKVNSDKLLKALVHVDGLKKCIYPVIKPEQDLSNIAEALQDLCDSDINDDEFQPLGATPSNVQDSDENYNSEYYMVENAIYQRDSNQGKQYFVKWKHFPTSSNSWVNESDEWNSQRN